MANELLNYFNFIHFISAPQVVNDVNAINNFSKAGMYAIQVLCSLPVVTNEEL